MNITKAAATKVRQATWTILAAASISMLGSVAQASDSGDSAPQRTVGYADLDLTSTKGATVLYSRLTSAANAVCGRVVGDRDLARIASSKACVDQSMVHAITAVNDPMLTSVYLARTGMTDQRFATMAMNR